MGTKCPLYRAKPRPKCRVGRRNPIDESGLPLLTDSYQQCGGDRYADGTTNVSHQIVNACRITNLVAAKCAHGIGGKRNKQQAGGKTIDDDRQRDGELPNLQIDTPQIIT